jgi:hypothetical protein
MGLIRVTDLEGNHHVLEAVEGWRIGLAAKLAPQV